MKSKNKKQVRFHLDKMYDTIEIRKMISEKNYKPIIPKNTRNIKDENNLTHMSASDKKYYRKRIVNEHTFSWITQYPILTCQYQKTIKSYAGLYMLASSYIVFVKMKEEQRIKKQSDQQKK